MKPFMFCVVMLIFISANMALARTAHSRISQDRLEGTYIPLAWGESWIHNAIGSAESYKTSLHASYNSAEQLCSEIGTAANQVRSSILELQWADVTLACQLNVRTTYDEAVDALGFCYPDGELTKSAEPDKVPQGDVDQLISKLQKVDEQMVIIETAVKAKLHHK